MEVPGSEEMVRRERTDGQGESGMNHLSRTQVGVERTPGRCSQPHTLSWEVGLPPPLTVMQGVPNRGMYLVLLRSRTVLPGPETGCVWCSSEGTVLGLPEESQRAVIALIVRQI